ncbi:tetratricopeptide repeat protein [Sphingomonas naphthae]|uniref:Tetratricopeptide repeat protein n=1 Tax=Sphingomonas naphthae TaxID=1813468 RepID=A0ABY7TK28_9SPHN|nr:tetratricopeptide repeat protein [Sphingomonas naphthae]WCT73311.1 tetratricopeptide repeat protein [Sphingomonas naphthae]
MAPRVLTLRSALFLSTAALVGGVGANPGLAQRAGAASEAAAADAAAASSAARASAVAAKGGAAGTAALLKQAQYWKGKNRPDLAIAALRRALAVDPNNAQAKALLVEYSKPPALPSNSGVQISEGPKTSGNASTRLGDRAAAQVAGTPQIGDDSTPVPADVAGGRRASPATTGGNTGPRTVRPTPPKPYVRSAADQAGEYRIAGFKAIEEGKLAYAEDRFRAALKINGNDYDALGGMGIVRLRGGRFDEARQLLDRASKGPGGSKWNAARQSAVFYGQLRVAQAASAGNRLAQAEAATKALNPSDARQDALARSLLGDIYARQGRYAEAMQMYASIPNGGGAAGRQSVMDIQTRQTRLAAMQAASRGDYAGAERIFQQAMVAGSTDPWLRYEYARLLVAQNRVQQADGVIGPLTQSNQSEALYAAALYSSQVNRPQAAEQLMSRVPAASRTPQMNAFVLEQRANSAVAQAKALAAAGRTPEALGLLRQLASQPLSIAGAGAVCDALYTLGDTRTAVALAQSAAAQPVIPEPDSYQGIVVTLAKAGLDQVAVPLVSRISAQSGQNPYNSRSMARLNALLAASQADRMRLQGQYAPAFELLQNAYQTSPGDVDILAALARLYQAGRLYPQAETVYGLVRQQRPNDVGNLIGFTDAALGAGHIEAARESADLALRLAPGEPDIFLLMARIETARGKQNNALRWLQQARDIKGRQTMVYGAQLSPTNPFVGAPMQSAPQPINPFALTPRAATPGLPGGYAPGGYQQPRSPFSFAPIHTPAPLNYGAATQVLEG